MSFNHETLPPEERRFWHPHNYEILSGQLVAPGIPDVAEKELMRKKMNSYGKTWHVWSTNHGDKLPMGEAMLAWSFVTARRSPDWNRTATGPWGSIPWRSGGSGRVSFSSRSRRRGWML